MPLGGTLAKKKAKNMRDVIHHPILDFDATGM